MLRPILFALALAACCGCASVPHNYHGQPYAGKSPAIPGRVECALYDTGGEGVAYHDHEATNLATICCGGTFRATEGVDIGTINEHHKSLNGPLEVGQNYVGWIQQGEWVKYTVDVKKGGTYQVNARMTSASTKCAIRLLVNDEPTGSPISITRSTGDVHVWDTYTNLAQIKLKSGPQVLTLEFTQGQKGDQNYEWLDLVRISQ